MAHPPIESLMRPSSRRTSQKQTRHTKQLKTNLYVRSVDSLSVSLTKSRKLARKDLTPLVMVDPPLLATIASKPSSRIRSQFVQSNPRTNLPRALSKRNSAAMMPRSRSSSRNKRMLVRVQASRAQTRSKATLPPSVSKSIRGR